MIVQVVVLWVVNRVHIAVSEERVTYVFKVEVRVCPSNPLEWAIPIHTSRHRTLYGSKAESGSNLWIFTTYKYSFHSIFERCPSLHYIQTLTLSEFV
jgi:hypothetical protein